MAPKTTAGYSKKSLLEKLGLKPGWAAALLNPPRGYAATLGKLPADVQLQQELRGPLEFIQFFCRDKQELQRRIPTLKSALAPDGMLWVSWPKGASGVATDLNENIVREVGLAHGLVDVKVCAVDEVWSGLKFVIPVRDRRGRC